MRRLMMLMGVLMLLAACGQTGGNNRMPNIREEGFVIHGLSVDRWTYFSVESGTVVGQSDFLDEEADAQWAARKDWDLAICGDRMKTNGGASGQGLGGIQRDMEHNFQTLEVAPSTGYLQDSLMVVR